MQILKNRLQKETYNKIRDIHNPTVFEFLAKYIEVCKPSEVYVCTDTPEDLQYIRKTAVRNKEEAKLAIKGHTVHFDNYFDQARDKEHTKFLLPKGIDLGPEINAMDRDKGLKEIRSILQDSMKGRELYVKFYCLGPVNSPFSLPCIQLTDSSYVAHSEDLLYRQGYQEFLRMSPGDRFFKFVHTQGKLEEAGLGLRVSSHLAERRVYIDLEEEIIYSTNTQYGGNSIGLKKLAMRLAIKRASEEGWLTEHMLILGISGPGSRTSYLTGAFPSMCGKTSTAMIQGEHIVGDDIAFLRKKNGKIHAVNVEKGMFGIIEGINRDDDPLQWKAIHTPGEIIFSNVLVTSNNEVFWNGKTARSPSQGVNHSGSWFKGKRDEEGNLIPPSHRNARFTFDLQILENVDSKLHDPDGVEVSAILYGGRDSDTWVPLEEAFDWEHGIITKGASLESETTAATLGKSGMRVFNPMSNLDFLSIPIGRYIQNNLNFIKGVRVPPLIFSLNYFLKDKKGRFFNHKNDKQIWLKWIELRVHNEVKVRRTPTGLIPEYSDLQRLFWELQNKQYPSDQYRQQFTIRVPEHLAKIKRLKWLYTRRIRDTPPIVLDVLEQQKTRLQQAQKKFGEYIPPEKL
ncbi:MAG: phosphoenolpyruvate carboxykinase (GTP) [Methanobacteriota archaeon]